MKEQNKFNVSFYKVDEDDVMPFVEIKFKGKDGKTCSALMLMDSGSNVNALSTEMRSFIDENDWLPDESEKVVSLDNEEIEHPCAKFQFEMGGYIFNEKCLVFNNLHVMQIGDRMFIGIIGTRFMQKYHLAIDFRKMSVHTSDMTMEDLHKQGGDFIIPMEYGLKHYNGPILKIRGDKRDAIAFLDTGSDGLTVSQTAIEECGLTYKITSDVQSVLGGNGNVDAKECILNFRIADHLGNDIDNTYYKEEAIIVPHSFDVLEDGECDDEGKLLSPLEGMIGTPFIAKQKWILDFTAKAIYKL